MFGTALRRHESYSHFAESYQAVLQSSIESTETLGKQLESIKLKNEAAFGAGGLGAQMIQVAKVCILL